MEGPAQEAREDEEALLGHEPSMYRQAIYQQPKYRPLERPSDSRVVRGCRWREDGAAGLSSGELRAAPQPATAL